MDWYQVEVDKKDSVHFKGNFPDITPEKISHEENDENFGVIGGIIKNGEWSWLAYEKSILIISLKSRQTMSRYEFSASNGFAGYTIKTVEEVLLGKSVVLAVLLENNIDEISKKISANCVLVLYSVEKSQALISIELNFQATCLKFLDHQICQRSYLQNFNGVLAIGSDTGDVVLLNIELKRLQKLLKEVFEYDKKFHQCKIFDSNLTLPAMRSNYILCQKEDFYFALKLESAANRVNCIVPIDIILGLAVGHENGLISFYDLIELQIFTIAESPSWLKGASIRKLNFIIPPDDPRPVLYVWAMHEKINGVSAVMHSIMFEKRVKHEDGIYYFENFINCLKSLEIPLESAPSTSVECQAIYKMSTNDEHYLICLCAFTWYSWIEQRTKLVLFDLNQWYKEQMPTSLDVNEKVSFLACFNLIGKGCALSTYLNSNTVAPFNTMQRIEEHFYPNSLSFDIRTLLATDANGYYWPGLQNKVIDMMRASSATLFLKYKIFFDSIINASLLPQFNELKPTSTFSRNAIYEVILSVALEHNCMNLLNSCVECWSNGSFMGQYTGQATDLGLSTLTDWIWKRASDIKMRCNELGKGIFEYGGYPLDQREKKEFAYITRQMRLLSVLLKKILTNEKHKISEKIYHNLESKYKSMCDAVGYQEVLSWLINVGLLPEGSYYNSDATEIVQYPCIELKSIYKERRASFAKLSQVFMSKKKTGYCRLLYIDAFLERTFPGHTLDDYWTNNDDNDGLYPPISLEKLLNVLLVPDVDFNDKCIVLLYFFLDVHMMLDAEAHKNIIQSFIKFPGVFKLSSTLIKTVQAFWSLDHKEFLPAVEEFTSPMNNIPSCPQWAVELLIESLILQDHESLALRVLESACSVSPKLRMKTLIANSLISEAFQYIRTFLDKELLESYFRCCLKIGHFNAVCSLALSTRESSIFQDVLKNHKSDNGGENLHLLFLLKRSKYLEALSYLDDKTRAQNSPTNSNDYSQRKQRRTESESTMTTSSTIPRRMRNIESIDTSNMVISAYNSTITPVSRGLTDNYFRIKNKMKHEIEATSPVPFSCQLIRQNANDLPGGIYQSSALSTLLATSRYNELIMPNGERQTRLTASESMISLVNAPFLHKMQILPDHHEYDMIQGNYRKPVQPKPYQKREKRTFIESDLYENETAGGRSSANELENPKKRRRLREDIEMYKDAGHFSRCEVTYDKINLNENDLRAPIGKTTRQLMTPSIDAASVFDEDYINPLSPLKSPTSGILKAAAAAASSDEATKTNDDVKSLRFTLPPPPSSATPSAEDVVEEAASSICSTERNDDNTNDLINVAEEEEEKKFQEPYTFDAISSDLSAAIAKRPCSRSLVFRPPQEIDTIEEEEEVEEQETEEQEQFEKSPITQRRTATPHRRDAIKCDTEQNVTVQHEDEKNQDDNEVEKMDVDEEMFFSPLSSPNQSRLSLSGPKPRKSLLENENVDSSTTSAAYYSCLSQMPESTNSDVSTSKSSHTAISSFMSKFEPKIYSSKVGETESKFHNENDGDEEQRDKTLSEIKISERSTVEGTILSELLESHEQFISNVETVETVATKQTVSQQKQMMDTTLGMSSYDLTSFMSTQSQEPQQPPSKQEENLKEKENDEETSNSSDNNVSHHSDHSDDSDDSDSSDDNDDKRADQADKPSVVISDDDSTSTESALFQFKPTPPRPVTPTIDLSADTDTIIVSSSESGTSTDEVQIIEEDENDITIRDDAEGESIIEIADGQKEEEKKKDDDQSDTDDDDDDESDIAEKTINQQADFIGFESPTTSPNKSPTSMSLIKQTTIDSGIKSASSDLTQTQTAQEQSSIIESEENVKVQVTKPIKKHILNELEQQQADKHDDDDESRAIPHTPRRTRRPSDRLEENLTEINMTPARRITRSSSINTPTTALELPTTPKSTKRSTRATSVQPLLKTDLTTPKAKKDLRRALSTQLLTKTDDTSTPTTRVDTPVAQSPAIRKTRASSVQPTSSSATTTITPTLSKRVLSEDLNVSTPRLRSLRKSTLQKSDEGELNVASAETTPTTTPSGRYSLRGSSQPPASITKRRPSNVLEVVTEGAVDTPTTPRTRARTRLASIDNADSLALTPSATHKRTRIPSISEQTEDSVEKRLRNNDGESQTKQADDKETEEYTSSRRLTRHQTAILEKTTATKTDLPQETTTRSKRRPSRRMSEAEATQDSDAESVQSSSSKTSKTSNKSKVAGKRATKKKDDESNKQEDDDELSDASIESTTSTSKQHAKKTSKAKKSLDAIEEDQEEDDDDDDKPHTSKKPAGRSRKQNH